MAKQRKTYPKVIGNSVPSIKQLADVKDRQRKRAVRGPKVKHYSE